MNNFFINTLKISRFNIKCFCFKIIFYYCHLILHIFFFIFFFNIYIYVEEKDKEKYMKNKMAIIKYDFETKTFNVKTRYFKGVDEEIIHKFIINKFKKNNIILEDIKIERIDGEYFL